MLGRESETFLADTFETDQCLAIRASATFRETQADTSGRWKKNYLYFLPVSLEGEDTAEV